MTSQQPSSKGRGEPRIIIKPVSRVGSDDSTQLGNSNRVLLLIGLGMVLLFLFGCVYLFRNEISERLSAGSDKNPDSEEIVIVEVESPFVAETRREKIIVEYLSQQDARDVKAVLSYWAPYVERYYELQFPDHFAMADKYLKIWDKVSYSKNTVVAMREFGTSRIEVDVKFEFRNKGGRQERSVFSTVVFEFDQRDRLISEYVR